MFPMNWFYSEWNCRGNNRVGFHAPALVHVNGLERSARVTYLLNSRPKTKSSLLSPQRTFGQKLVWARPVTNCENARREIFKQQVGSRQTDSRLRKDRSTWDRNRNHIGRNRLLPDLFSDWDRVNSIQQHSRVGWSLDEQGECSQQPDKAIFRSSYSRSKRPRQLPSYQNKLPDSTLESGRIIS